MAVVLMEQRRYEEARRHLSIALGYKPDSTATLRNLALVAELDGGPATVEASPGRPFWKRFAAAMEKVFLGPDEKGQGTAPPAGTPASAAARE
jgi:hypothetical protein